ncbi:hypothetical protein MHK_002490 [Candidatus Magnetomorum sp. HK-1]|nr:hypothetical protein MHK_002490 [Candidatus Magnetomorum sp. HK-1]
MLTFRNQQLNDLRKIKEDQFIEKALLFLRSNYPVQTKSFTEKELDQSIRSGMKRAKSYNLLSEKGMIAFIELTYTLTDDFDNNINTGWTKTILSNPDLSESQKLTSIINQLNAV